jgi:hypothetical protein
LADTIASLRVQERQEWTPAPPVIVPPTHIVIPDTQVRPGSPIDHLGWIGEYIVEEFDGTPTEIIHLGDHWEMDSLSHQDKGRKSMEGRRYPADVEAGNHALAILSAPIQRRRRWHPGLHLIRGNHEERINTAIENNPQLSGSMSDSDLQSPGWTVYPFLEVADIDGIGYSHYFQTPMTDRPYSSSIDSRLSSIGHSFTHGHQQTLLFGTRYVRGQQQNGLVCGTCYTHSIEYLGPQSNAYWRGIIVCRNVVDGGYDPQFVSLDALCRRYEGMSLEHFQRGRS